LDDELALAKPKDSRLQAQKNRKLEFPVVDFSLLALLKINPQSISQRKLHSDRGKPSQIQGHWKDFFVFRI
jgi:hypothetical protein